MSYAVSCTMCRFVLHESKKFGANRSLGVLDCASRGSRRRVSLARLAKGVSLARLARGVSFLGDIPPREPRVTRKTREPQSFAAQSFATLPHFVIAKTADLQSCHRSPAPEAQEHWSKALQSGSGCHEPNQNDPQTAISPFSRE